MKKIYLLGFVLMVLFAMTMSATAMEKKTNNNPNPGVLPLDSKLYGSTYGEWSAKWWQWVWSIPAASNPVIDQNGDFCGEGQSGNVWFLAGNFGGQTERTCTVPAGKSLFFPIINVAWINLPGDNFDDAIPAINDIIDHTTKLNVKVDGVSLKNLWDYRVMSPVFEAYFPPKNIYGYTEGNYDLNIADGYWLMLAPLSAGKHVISINSENSLGFELDVTYDLTVKSRNSRT